MMAEKPIIFSGEMVRAILASRKTQTRRVVKPQPNEGFHMRHCPNGKWYAYSDKTLKFNFNGRTEDAKWRCQDPYKPKYAIGDILWVRETFCLTNHGNPVYKADCRDQCGDYWESVAIDPDDVSWRPSIHMPRKAARLFLKVTNVRCERLQDITEADARAEGVSLELPTGLEYATYVDAYGALWDSLNAKRGYGWETNPLVWVIEFERVESCQAL